MMFNMFVIISMGFFCSFLCFASFRLLRFLSVVCLFVCLFVVYVSPSICFFSFFFNLSFVLFLVKKSLSIEMRYYSLLLSFV
jgi:hypothetical protein